MKESGVNNALLDGKDQNPPNILVGKPKDDLKTTESSNPIIRLILRHYRINPPKKSDAQIKREKYLIPQIILFNRWFLMPAAVLIQFCCGSLYAWSVFNKPIDRLIYGEVVNIAPITFYIAVLFFGISAALMGPWLERNGPLKACALGTSLFFLGNLITALALYLQQIWLVFIGYGAVCGFGLGLCYISPVSALQKWFPDKRGLASGFAVCGFGAGSVVIAKVQIPLIENVGLPLTFVVLGSAYFICMISSALVLRTPPPVSDSNQMKEEEPKMSLVEAITSTTFRLMYIMFIANAVFGLVVISRLSNMITDIFGRSPEEASTIVAINGGFNLGGRLIMSILSDYVGRKNCYVIMLTTQLVILASFSTITSSQAYWAFVLTMWLLTACYGSGFGIIPAFLSDKFGSSNIGACHGIILTAWSLAGVGGGLIFTAIFDKIIADGTAGPKEPYPYNINAWWIFSVVLIGWFTTLFIQPTIKDAAFTNKFKYLFCNCCGEKKKGKFTFTA